mgnify:CR=1 FL=1
MNKDVSYWIKVAGRILVLIGDIVMESGKKRNEGVYILRKMQTKLKIHN